MAQQRFTNNADTTVSGAVGASDPTIVLAAASGADFPSITGGDYFVGTLYELNGSGQEINHEIVKVTARVADTLTVVRGFDSTTGRAYPDSLANNPSQVVYFSLRYTAHAADNALYKDANLADLASPATARTNLGISATNTPFTPAGNIAATTVQAAIAELDGEKQPLDATLTALAGVTTSADKLVYATGADTFSTTTLTAFARSILDDVDEATFKATVNLEIGTDVQAYSANLTEYAAVNPTAAGLALLDDLDAAAQRTTLGLAIGTDVQAYDADTAKLDVAQSWTANQTPNNGTASVSTTSTYTFTGDDQVKEITFTNAIMVTFGAPSGITEHCYYTFKLKAGDASARTFAWNSAYKFPGASPSLTSGTTTSGAFDLITFIGGASNTLQYVGHQADVR